MEVAGVVHRGILNKWAWAMGLDLEIRAITRIVCKNRGYHHYSKIEILIIAVVRDRMKKISIASLAIWHLDSMKKEPKVKLVKTVL